MFTQWWESKKEYKLEREFVQSDYTGCELANDSMWGGHLFIGEKGIFLVLGPMRERHHIGVVKGAFTAMS